MTELKMAQNGIKKMFKNAIWDSDFSQRDLVRMINSEKFTVSESELSQAINGGMFPKHEKIRKAVAKILKIQY